VGGGWEGGGGGYEHVLRMGSSESIQANLKGHLTKTIHAAHPIYSNRAERATTHGMKVR
jgi:hypothetical protein